MIDTLDSWTQTLTTASMWVQIPVILVLLVPFSAVLSLVWLRCVDLSCALMLIARQRIRNRGRQLVIKRAAEDASERG
ncbi:MAG: hypothetical protein Q3976_04000 [Corynebacterium sp.]|nr:hypothetical protein [Corynebacterium sp.]